MISWYRTRRWLMLGLLVFIIDAVLGGMIVQATPTTPQFAPLKCASISSDIQLPADFTEGKDVQCGYVTVLEDHQKPSGGTIQLAVAILKSIAAKPKPDGIIYLDGGPGASSLSALNYYGDALTPLRGDRDVVLLDQRGTYYSTPSLACPEETKVTYDVSQEVISMDKATQLDETATQQCHDRLAKSGVDFSVYNSSQNAADVNDVMTALGYPTYNL